MDHSEKDNLYFIDQDIYNCPFCQRRNVKYSVTDTTWYHTGTENIMHVYQVKCSDCDGNSLHFTLDNLFPTGYNGTYSRFRYSGQLDDHFLAHRPAVLHIMDNEVPKKLRILMAEADESRQSNLLTGASAALRKTIYQLLSLQKVAVVNEKTKHTDYKSSIYALRDKYTHVDPELFDLLAGVQELASDLVHEDSWVSWDAKQLRILTAIVYEILEEIYAEPARRKRRKEGLLELRARLSADKDNKSAS